MDFRDEVGVVGFRVLGFGNLWGLDSRVYGQWGLRVSLPAFFGGGLRVELKEAPVLWGSLPSLGEV